MTDPIAFDPTPSDSPPPPASSVRWAWPLLFLVFGLLIAVSIANSFAKEEGGESKLGTYGRELRIALRLSGATPQNTKAPPRRENLQSLLARLQQLPRSESRSFAVSVVRHELRSKALPEDLKVLSGSENPGIAAAARLYGQPPPSEAQAADLANLIGGPGFFGTLARVHAQEIAEIPNSRREAVRPFTGATLAIGGLLVLGVLFAIPAVYTVYGYMRLNGKWPPQGHPAMPIHPGESDRFAGRTLATLALFFFAPLFLLPLTSRLIGPAQQALAMGIITAGVVALFAHPALRGRIDLKRVGLTTENLGRNVMIGVAGALANIPFFVVAGLIAQLIGRILPMPTHPVAEQMLANRDPMVTLSILLTAAVFVPIWEELSFRGALFGGMIRLFRSPVWAAVVSSLLFAAIHPTGIPSWLALATVGGMSCFLIYQTRSLVPSIVLHAVHNGTLLVLSLFLA